MPVLVEGLEPARRLLARLGRDRLAAPGAAGRELAVVVLLAVDVLVRVRVEALRTRQVLAADAAGEAAGVEEADEGTVAKRNELTVGYLPQDFELDETAGVIENIRQGARTVLDMIERYEAVTAESVKAATVLLSIGPIILAYPFIQRYFVKGIMIGSIKG